MQNREIRFGPYSPPRVTIDEEVQCEVRGLVTVHAWRDGGSMMWPTCLRPGRSQGREAMIVCGDLIRALRREAATAIARHWGVSIQTVRRWRRALDIGRYTEGTRALLAEGGNMEIGTHAVTAAQISLLPENRKRRDASHAATLRGKLGWAEQMGRIGKKGGRNRMAALTPKERSELARLAGLSANFRTRHIKATLGRGEVFRYERLRDRYIVEERIKGTAPKEIAERLGLSDSDMYSLLRMLASGYPVLASQILTPRQIVALQKENTRTPSKPTGVPIRQPDKPIPIIIRELDRGKE